MAAPTERPKRFYKIADTGVAEDGFVVLLDGRPPRSPAGKRLIVPTRPLAEMIAEEWAAQAPYVELAHMPATRLAYTAIDRIGVARAVTIDEIVGYAGADLLCYRAEAPASLTERQAAQWGPLLDWARDDLGLTFIALTGIVHRPQLPATLNGVSALAGALDDFALAGLAYATVLFGSAVLALAVLRRRLTAVAAFDLSRLDEDFQERQWGVDAEAAERTALRRLDAAMVGAWFQALG